MPTPRRSHRRRPRRRTRQGRPPRTRPRNPPRHVPELRVADVAALAGLDPHQIAVQLGERDGHRSAEQGSDDDSRARRMVLQRHDQRQADDRAVDDPRDMTRPQVRLDRAPHSTAYGTRKEPSVSVDPFPWVVSNWKRRASGRILAWYLKRSVIVGVGAPALSVSSNSTSSVHASSTSDSGRHAIAWLTTLVPGPAKALLTVSRTARSTAF